MSPPDPHASAAPGLPGDADVSTQTTLFLPTYDEEDQDALTATSNTQRRNRILAAVAGVVILALIAGYFVTRHSTNQTPIVYQYATVTQGTLALTVSGTGPLQSALYNVIVQGTSTLKEIDVSVGQAVTAGQVLGKLDPTSLQNALTQAEIQVNSAQNSVNSANLAITNAQDGITTAQTALTNAQTNLSNVQAQVQAQQAVAYDTEQTAIAKCTTTSSTPTPAGTATPTPVPTPVVSCDQQAQDTYNATVASLNAQVTSAQNQITTAQNGVKSAQAALVSAQNGYQSALLNQQTAQVALQTAQTNLANATITAPHSGQVTQVNGQVGNAPGAPFVQIADLSQMQVLVNVNEADISKVAIGQVATFSVLAFKGRTFTGKVTTISPAGVTTQGVVTYPVTIDVTSTPATGVTLLPAMTATVTIVTQQRRGVVLIPATAVTFAVAAAPAGSYKLLACGTVTQAYQTAVTDLQTDLQATATLAQDSPQAAYVVEQDVHNNFTAVPVVLGLTDGTRYIAVQGVSVGDRLVVGRTGGTTTTTTGSASTSFLQIPGTGGGRGGAGGAGGGRGNGNGTSTGGTSTGGAGGTGFGGRGGAGIARLLCGASAPTPTP